MKLHVVEAFLGERNVNTPMHARNLQALDNAVYVEPKEVHEENVHARSFMQDLCGDNDIFENNQEHR